MASTWCNPLDCHSPCANSTKLLVTGHYVGGRPSSRHEAEYVLFQSH